VHKCCAAAIMHRAAACVAAAAAARRAVRRQPTGPRYDANARPRRARARALQLAPYPRAAAAYDTTAVRCMRTTAHAQRACSRTTRSQPSFVAGATPKAIEIGQPQSPWWVPANVTHHPE
jgi:hypothetical protein